MKSLLALLLCVSTVLHAAPAGRERLRFDDGWKFHLHDASLGQDPTPAFGGEPVGPWRWKIAPNPAAETAEVTRSGYDDHAWVVIPSGHNRIRDENTFAWFRGTLPKATGPKPRLHFAGVDDVATVYLNGKQIAQHEGWTEPFDVALDAAWKPDGENVVVVLVENIGGPGGLDDVRFQSDDTALPALAESGPAAVNYDDHAWRTVQLPHDFIVEGKFDPQADASHGFLPKAAGWYRKTFDLPADDKGRVLWLEFDGVYRNSFVWLNGHPLGRHYSGYTSFYYDVSQFANFGGQNVLTVWADARQNEGWWYEGGGIYRHVYLTKLAPVHVAHWGTKVEAKPSEDFQSVAVDAAVDIENNGPDGTADLEYNVVAPDGQIVVRSNQRTNLPFKAGDTRTIEEGLKFSSPKLWSPDTPNLYTLKAVVRLGGVIIDELDTTFGVRSLRWDKDQGFFLNGQPFKIQGTCNHQDFAGLGVALPDRVHSYKVEKLKEMGSNAFRFSHQPMAPELLDVCDRLGMVVMDENRKLGDSPEILGQVESLVRRDRNHPSVIMWSMCNEESLQGSPRGGKMFAAMKNVVLNWDKTRPVTAAMNGGYGSGISLVDDLQGFNYNTPAYDDFHRRFPKIPCYGSETASETTTRGIYEDDKERGYVSIHRTTAENAWKPIAERPFMAGGFVWTGFDYRGEPTPYQWPCVSSHFGIMDTCGFPKDSYYYYLAEWGGKPLVHLSAQWNQPRQDGQEISVWVTGNARRCELFLNGASLGAQEMSPHRHAEWKVKYAPGALEVRGYDADGKQVATDKLETTGASAGLRLVPDRPEFTADGEDVVLLRCAVVDTQKRVVPTAGDEVTFRVEGPAHVAGVGNGDPSDHDPDKASQRHAFNGHCLAIVQAERQIGEVTVVATAPGLHDATVRLQTH